MKPLSIRVRSIDHFRALTMFLMVFVNDFWTLRAIPQWLGHAAAGEDRLGFSDIIFPAFLYIVGLSIPFALQQRLSKPGGIAPTLVHISGRTLALLVMGLFLVNLENINGTNMQVPVVVWRLLLIVAFFLVWNKYPKASRLERPLKGVGIGILVFLAFTFKGGGTAQPEGMKTHWWGILGLIGWAYLTAAIVYFFARERLLPNVLVWLALLAINVLSATGMPDWLQPVLALLWPIGNGSLAAMTMAGVVTALLLRGHQFATKERLTLVLIAWGAACILVGILIRPHTGGISKMGGTPAWSLVCTGISLLVFSLLNYFDRPGSDPLWARLLKPAGAATLTCYLIPYIVYPLAELSGIKLPEMVVTGTVGLLKSLVYSAAVVAITGALVKRGVQLKI